MEWYGPYICKDKRKRMYLYDGKQVVTSMSYARYLLQQKLGRDLTDKEEAHHKDEDKTNDSIDNLEVKDSTEHRIDHNRVYWEGMYFNCPECELDFFVEPAKLTRIFRRKANGARGPFCGRSCVGKFANRFI